MAKISALIIKQLFKIITPEERKELDNYAAESEENRQMVEKYTDGKKVLEEIKLSEQFLNEEDWLKIEANLPKNT